MKKLVISLAVFMGTMGISNAFYYENEMSTVDSLLKQGYSPSMAQIVDTNTSHMQGHDGNYNRVFTRKGKNALSRAYRNFKDYFDPAQDDGLFGEHKIEFTNTWNGDIPGYANPYNSNLYSDNL